MATLGDSLKDIMFAGIGAVAVTAEKSKEVIDMLVEKGELTFDQGKQLNQELQRKATETAKTVRDSAVEARMKAMSPEEREAFAAMVADLAAAQNAEDATKEAEEQAEVEVEVEIIEETDAEAAEASADSEQAE